ncbi:MAG: Hsp20/alpha crystallin family protein [Candidatus Zixiibacteriota bacterium]
MAKKMILFREKKKVHDEHLRVFASFSHLNTGALHKMISKWHPPTDVYHTDDKLVIISEISGIDRDEISIVSEGSLLRIQGERSEITCSERATYLNMEINFGAFERNINLPKPFIGGRIIANYNNGFLKIEVEKADNINIKVE